MQQLELSFDASVDEVDTEIAQCLNTKTPRSFFLFAGAGSGKTRALVTALHYIRGNLGDALRLKGQRVGVITYTNAACEEIKSRLRFDPLIDVRTIHAFAWSLIDGFNNDIREWLRADIKSSVEELTSKQAKGRAGKASQDRTRKIASGGRRLERLDHVRRFVYSPVGDDLGRDALNHTEVISLASHFLTAKPAMQSLLVGRYPILFIDESQDTNEKLIDALVAVESARKGTFTLGLFGDTMQRIYFEGKEELGRNLPVDWATPSKKINHRCPRRVVALINKIRLASDDHLQQTRGDAPEGMVRLFLLPGDVQDKQRTERSVVETMALATGDEGWNNREDVKTLILEHRMAATRMGFQGMFEPLYEVSSWRNSLLEGRLPATRFFSEQVVALVHAARANDNFGFCNLMKRWSPLLSREALKTATDKVRYLKDVNVAVSELLALWQDREPLLREVLRSVAKNKLLQVPESLESHATKVDGDEVGDVTEDLGSPREVERARGLRDFLNAPFSQVELFADYVAGRAAFDTHHGVKGREFERVMVVMDDQEARGFQFKYDNLFGGKPVGDRSVDATRRLFYVTCSRAKSSLALVAYSTNVSRTKSFMIEQGWFSEKEIVTRF